MDIQNHLIAKCDQAWSDYQKAFIRRAPVEEQDRLLREWSATHLRLLFFTGQEDARPTDSEHYRDGRETRDRN